VDWSSPYHLRRRLPGPIPWNGSLIQGKFVGGTESEISFQVGYSVQKYSVPDIVAICGSGVGGSICANKFPGVGAALINDAFSAPGVEDDRMNIICLGGRIIGSMIAWDLVATFLAAEFSQGGKPPAPFK
jgi:RpiB/LacA/LacB family sugar-phosphate isomerase